MASLVFRKPSEVCQRPKMVTSGFWPKSWFAGLGLRKVSEDLLKVGKATYSFPGPQRANDNHFSKGLFLAHTLRTP